MWIEAKGCVIPALFNLALERVIRKIQKEQEMEVLGRTTLLVYADDIVILGESKKDLEDTVRKLIVININMSIKINENKANYMVMSRHKAPFQNINVQQFSFEQVEHFKHLSTNINHENNVQNEIKCRISATN